LICILKSIDHITEIDYVTSAQNHLDDFSNEASKSEEVKIIAELEGKQVRCPKCHEEFRLTHEILDGQA